MRLLLDQLENSLQSGNYYLSLFTALAIPDIAGAMESENGLATGAKYANWFNTWVRPRFNDTVQALLPEHARELIPNIESPFDNEACYLFRCSLLHQGRTIHPRSEYSRIIFIEPQTSTNIVHYSILEGALCIDLVSFCSEIITGTRMWLEASEETELFQRNYEPFVKRHANGLNPHIGGVPVVG